MTFDCFAKGMGLFLVCFSNVKASEQTQKAWYELLKDLTDEQFTYAVTKICREVKQFYPTDNFAALIREQVTVSLEERSLFAWEEVVKAMRQHGAYQSVKFDDPVIHSVVQIMASGWSEFCQIPLDKWMQKQFVDTYKIMSKKNTHPEYLKGIFEIENTVKGYLDFVKPPKQIETGIRRRQLELGNIVHKAEAIIRESG